MKINNQNYGIEVKNLSFSYENDGGYSGMALQNVNFTADFGECVGIIGANGAGKSTFLKILVGLLGGYTGDVNIGGLEINKKNLSDIRRIEGYVFQDSDSQLFMSSGISAYSSSKECMPMDSSIERRSSLVLGM